MTNSEQQLISAIEADLTKRVAGSEPLLPLATVSGADHSAALAAMSSGDSKSLPGMMLVSAESPDSLQGASISPGGYNALVGAKVPAGAVGVISRLGKVFPDALEPGWHWKNPLSHVEMMSTRLIADTVKAQAASHDLQQVTIELTIPFSLNPKSAPEVFQKIGNLDQVESVVINPGVLESVKAVAAKYTAEEIITKREEVKDTTEELLKKYIATTLEQKGISDAIGIGNIAITHFNFSDDFNKSIELKVKAEQDALRAENEKRQKVTEAEAQRDSEKAKADGEAYATEVRSKAEAAAIQRRGEALRDNPQVIDLEKVHQWDGKLPVYTGNAPIPFINVDDVKQQQSGKAPVAVEAKSK